MGLLLPSGGPKPQRPGVTRWVAGALPSVCAGIAQGMVEIGFETLSSLPTLEVGEAERDG